MPKFNEYPERSSFDSTDIFLCIDEDGNIYQVPNSVVQGDLATTYASKAAANEFSDENDFTTGTVKVAQPTADDSPTPKDWTLAQIAAAVGLNPDSANTWNGIQTFKKNNIHDGEESFNELVNFIAGVVMNMGELTVQSDQYDYEMIGNGTAYLNPTDFWIATSSVIMSGLPTADPLSAGKLWNNLGVLSVSAG